MYYIAFFTERKCFDRYLPDLPAWNQSLLIPQSYTGLAYDLPIHLRSLENICYMEARGSVKWVEPKLEAEQQLREDRPLQFMASGMRFSVMVRQCRREDTKLRKYRFAQGSRITIGTGKESSVCQQVQLLSANHAEIIAQGQTAIFVDHSRNGSYVNGDRINNGQCQIRLGDVLTLGMGLKMVYLGDMIALNTPGNQEGIRLDPIPPVQHGGDEIPEANEVSTLVNYHRSPRFVQVPDESPIKIEGPLTASDQKQQPLWMTIGPSATMILPMMLSSLVTGRDMASMIVMMGGTAALSVFWGTFSARYRKKEAAESAVKRQRIYSQYIRDTEANLMALSEQEMLRLEDEFLSVNQCLELPAAQTHRLWERTTNHDDFSTIRLGTGERRLPNDIQIPEEKLSLNEDPMRHEPERLKSTYGYIAGAPITMRLREKPIVGVLGHQRNPWLMQSIVMQLAALHSYHDLRIAILTDRRNSSQWAWARWLPHVFLNEDRSLRMVVSEQDAVQEVLAALENVWANRDELAGEENEAEKKNLASPLPHYVIFCTNPDIMENSMVLKHILDRPLGFTVVMMAYNMERLPKECTDIIQASESQGAVFNSRGEVQNITFERAELNQLNQFGAQIAPIRVQDVMENAAIPTYLSFLDVYHVRSVDDLDVWRFWNENKAYEGLKATVGYGTGMRPFVLDISDKPQSHGPHGLVAGTTGSGKSVMLQTYILSLALNYHPNQVQFILIDYKGGGMAGPFLGLPHLAGVIDNLQGERSIARALASIKGEIKRREEAFKALGLEHIDDYIRLANSDPSIKPLAHIIIIVDEFAELKREQPDFMRELVSAARVGRSVGMHLILATQKPSNSVDDEIWSNTRFRICLRVAGRSDSNDMLKRPDAAYLKGMGRCYVQVGNDEIFEQVQTSYSGADYNPTALSAEEIPQLLSSSGRPIRVKRKNKNDEKALTQMEAVTGRIRQVTAERNVPMAQRLWLEELENFYQLEKLAGMEGAFDGKSWPKRPLTPVTIPYAMLDDTEGQRHECISLDLSTNRNHILVGPAASGKTTLIQTIALSLAMRYTPEQVNMYIMSLTSNMLDVLRDLPHVGDVVLKNHPEEIGRLLDMIAREDARRRGLFEKLATDSFEQYNAVAAKDPKIKPLPVVVVLIDRFAQVMEALNDDQMKQVRQMVEESSSRGIYFIITALSVTRNEVPMQMRDSFRGVALRMGDRDAFREVLNGGPIDADKADIMNTPGRGLTYWNGGAAETQAAVYASNNDQERAQAIRELAKQMNAAWTGRTPAGILRIPENFHAENMLHLAECNPLDYPKGQMAIGITKLTGLPAMLDFNQTPELLITGVARSGKTTAMLGICEVMRMQGAKIHLFGRHPLLGDYATAHAGDVKLLTPEGQDTVNFFYDELRALCVGRYQQLKAKRPEGAEAVRELSATFEPVVVAIDDVADFVKNTTPEICDFIGQTIVSLKQAGVWFLLGAGFNDLVVGKTRQPLMNALTIPQGLVMGGRLSEMMPWNVPISIELKRTNLPLGEGMLLRDNDYEPISVPQP